MMIKFKRGFISLKKNHDLTCHKESRWTNIKTYKEASVGDKLKKRFECDSLNRLLHQLFLSHEKGKKEIQDVIVSYWEQSKGKICLDLYLEYIPLTTKCILLLNERYINNFARTTTS